MSSNENKRKPAGIGVGYLSIMMIFVVLCLTMLAALSYSTASSENRYSEKSAAYTQAYYSSDHEAKYTLAEVDSIISQYGDYGDFMLLSELDAIENIEYETVFGGIEVSWSTPISGPYINSNQSIFSKVRFTDGGFEIISWRTVSNSERDNEKQPPDVWLGE